MRIKFEFCDWTEDCLTPCPFGERSKNLKFLVMVNSIACGHCPHYRGTEGNEVICGREEE